METLENKAKRVSLLHELTNIINEEAHTKEGGMDKRCFSKNKGKGEERRNGGKERRNYSFGKIEMGFYPGIICKTLEEITLLFGGK